MAGQPNVNVQFTAIAAGTTGQKMLQSFEARLEDLNVILKK
jgi:hypothetical protein